MEPILLTPAFKDYLWGGTKLKTEYGLKSDLDIVAESWELSVHKDGQSTVASGSDTGLSLSDYLKKCGRCALGKKAEAFDYFPLLIKLIDAKDNLSVQVHPSDAYALKNEGEYGKTEMWYILEAEPDASLYYGLNTAITKEEFQSRIENNTVLEVLHQVPVHRGDVFFIEAGTIHAIGKGIVICEIQQNSNTTYRVYDYDRRDKNGNTRPLHIQKALEVATLAPATAPAIDRTPINGDGYQKELLASCHYFTVEKLTVTGKAVLPVTEDSFQSLIVTDGSAALHMGDTVLPLKKGGSVFIPAQDNTYTIEGDCSLILSCL